MSKYNEIKSQQAKCQEQLGEVSSKMIDAWKEFQESKLLAEAAEESYYLKGKLDKEKKSETHLKIQSSSLSKREYYDSVSKEATYKKLCEAYKQLERTWNSLLIDASEAKGADKRWSLGDN